MRPNPLGFLRTYCMGSISASEIQAGQVYNWEGVIELPGNTNPSLSGKLIDHKWEIQAGLDMPGNDPDSGWQTLSVQ